jgi:flagellar biosynthesis chaperone FliJ
MRVDDVAQFRYRLQTLLDQKIRAKEGAQMALGAAQHELRASRDELEVCRRAQEACSEKLRNARAERVSLKTGGSSGEIMRWRRDHIVRLQDERDQASDATRSQELSVSETEERVAAARTMLATRSRDVEVLEKHRARLEGRHNQAAERKEAIDQEEMANVIFLRGRSAT